MILTSCQELGQRKMACVLKAAVYDCFPMLCDFVSRHRLLVRVKTLCQGCMYNWNGHHAGLLLVEH